MPATISPKVKAKYFALREEGFSQKEAAPLAGVSISTVQAWHRKMRNSSGVTWREDRHIREAVQEFTGARPKDALGPEALKALDDFAYFRRRYFGRKSTPWQEEVAYRLVDLLATKQKEYVVCNMPPGSGKSTLMTLDLAAWMTCRQRGIRGMIGSASQLLAERYLLRLRQALESPFPARAESEEIEMGLAFDAESSLIADFGVFKNSVMWTSKAFIVAQVDDRPISEKEPTWSAYGLDTAFIGGRFDVAIWDDATEDKHLNTLEIMEKQRDRWDKVAEKRLEPGGLLVLPGQRLGPEDLYRHNLNKKAGSSQAVTHDECCDAEEGKKYHHFVYRAHWEDRCSGEHDDLAYYPDSCLLDPNRLPWVELEAEMENNSSNFMQVYQQEDIDPAQTLVNPLWISGGTDPRTKELFPGCWDHDRGLWELPKLSIPFVSYLCVDPSPTRMWGITLWVYHPKTQLRFLIALMNTKMAVNQFFDYNSLSGEFTGILQDWYKKTCELGFPLSTLVFEQNGAQRFFLAQDSLRRWQQQTGVRIIGHETTARNKLDRELGPQILAELYKRGLIRLPGYRSEDQVDRARLTSMKLVDEVTKWPKGRADDLVMSQWFGEASLSSIYQQIPHPRITKVPTWMRRSA